MAHITSREQLEDWLKDKPDDWKQIIASRAGQRALPYSFVPGTPDEWVLTYSLVPFRSTLMSWSACNHADYPIRKVFDVFGEVSNMAAQEAINFDDSRAYSSIYASGHAASAMYPWSEFDKERGINDAFELWGSQNHLMGCLSNAVAYAEMAVGSHVMRSIHHDCNWLEAANASDGLGSVALWKAEPPYGWNEAWVSAANRLLALDPTYRVWIDWYNRRIEGHDAAFDIPADTGRVQDKAILARLADATNADFWDKGATYVNTTLQSWIDEARERVRPRDAPFVTDPLRQLDDELQSLIDEAREQVKTQGEESAPDPQNADVIQFRQTDTGQFDPDFSAGSDELLTDQAACDRHHALVATARDALSLCRGHNQIGHVAEHLIIVIDAAGDQPRTMRVDLLVARGERMVDDLRDAVNELQPDPEVALGNLREKRIVNVFNALIRDYTAMIKLDPALDRRQRLPHYNEENASAVSPQQALIFVNSSVTVGAITQSARDVIVEGARGLTEDGDVKDRKKWRFSETVRNLPRAMIGFLWQHRGGIVGSSVAGVSAVSMALITQEAAIRSFFATNPGMLSIIDELVGILRGIGM